MNEAAYIFVGALMGAVLVRYGIGLGYRMAQEGESLTAPKELPIEQEVTEEDEYNSQEHTEIL